MKLSRVMALFALVFLCSCAGDAVVIVEDRWWAASTLVQYTDTDVSVTIDKDGYPHTTVTSSTETRCRATNTGRDLPEVYPEPACKVHYGDRVNYTLYCYIAYHEQESKESRVKMASCDLWHNLEPGAEVAISWNVLRMVNTANLTRTRE